MVQRRLELGRAQPIGQRAEGLGRLAKPEARQQFGHLRRVLHPGWLPGHCLNQVCFLTQTGGDGIGQSLRPFRVEGAQSEHQFPGVSEVFLVKLQTLDRRFIGWQQVEDINVKTKPTETQTDRPRKQRPPPAFEK